ncbi:hypothetical protein FOA52_009164 [Chlamydomonas sp. UWO 241]|nr:hypothetical protein FOA52_009164 [Chlamydomonas sp. UWO 241]
MGGCATVSELPSSISVQHYAYKFDFNLYPQQWADVSAALRSQLAIRAGHVMCGSSIYFQTVSGTNTNTPLTPAANPSWLDASAGANRDTCYTDAYAALNGGI